MAKIFLVPIDLAKNEIRNVAMQVLASAPSSPALGQYYFDSTKGKPQVWDGSAWDDMDDVVIGSVVVQTSFGGASADGASGELSDADHAHGTPAHGAAAHSAIKLSDLAAPTADVPWNSQKITGLGTPTSDTDAATKAYVDAAAQGLDPKPSVRATTTANITLSGEQTIDGVSVVANDRVLVKDQSTAADNGIYDAKSGAWIRSNDADSSAEVTPGLFTFVEEGTANADTGWVLSTNAPITLGTTGLTFVQFSGAGSITGGAGLLKTGTTLDVVAGATPGSGGPGGGIIANTDDVVIDKTVVVRKYAANVGDNAATSFNIDHNLGTTDVIVQVFKISSGVQVEPDVTHSTTNRVILGFSVAPGTDEYRVVIHA